MWGTFLLYEPNDSDRLRCRLRCDFPQMCRMQRNQSRNCSVVYFGLVLAAVAVMSCGGGGGSGAPPSPQYSAPSAIPGGPYTGSVGVNVQFDGSKSTDPNGTNIQTFNWNFGDGTNGTGPTPTHAYSRSGSFTVSLTVTDAVRQTSKPATTTATISNAPVANPGGPYAGTTGAPVQFDGSKSSGPSSTTLTYAWDFGDGSKGTGVKPTHTYAKSGTFKVTLSVTDNIGGADTAGTQATISNPPVANAGGPYIGVTGAPVQFDGSKSTGPSGSPLTYSWTFGDGSKGTGVKPTHAYTGPGTFNVSLTVKDSVGGADSAGTTATITSSTAPAILGFSPTSVSVGNIVNVTGVNFVSSTGAGPEVMVSKEGGGILAAPIVTYTSTAISLVVPAGAATGPLGVTVGTQSASSSTPLTIVPSSGFTLSVVPSSANLMQSQSTSYAISLTGSNGYDQLAALSVTGVPAGIAAVFNPPQITAGQTSILTLTAPARQALGAATLHVSAASTVTGIPFSESGTATLVVQPLTTSFIGRTVVDNDQQTPLAGVTIMFLGKNGSGGATGCSGTTRSDGAGNFALANLPSNCVGSQMVGYDGSTATSPPGTYAGVNLVYTLSAGQATTPPAFIRLPRIDNGEKVEVQQNDSVDQSFCFRTIPGLCVTIYAGTWFTLADGTRPNPFGLIGIQVPVDRLPDQMPPSNSGVMPFIVAFQPANTVASQPVAVTFPNLLNTLPGTQMDLNTLDPTKGVMVMYGTGTVSTNGAQIVPDPDPAHPGHRYGLVHFDWHGPMPPPPPQNNPTPTYTCPPGATCSCPFGAGKRVDASSGIDFVASTDISLNSPRGPISIVRTYRTGTGLVGPFGIGTYDNYDYILDTAFPQLVSVINLVMPDGNRLPFTSQGNGTFVNTTVPTMRDVIMTLNQDNSVDVTWKNGTKYHFVPATFQLGSLLASITDANGNTITFTRNPNQPLQVTQITDPVGRSLTLEYDNSNRIVSITDPIGRQVQYVYNSQGTLDSFTDANGGVTRYAYDNNNNLLTVTDPRGVVVEQNTFDSNGRVAQQVEADEGVYHFDYTLNNSDPPASYTSPVLQTVITDPDGNQTTYRFNTAQLATNVTDSTGQMTTFTMDPNTNNLPTGFTGSATCDACPNPSTGNVTFTLDQNGNILTSTDALGNVTTYTYDPTFNKVTSIKDPLGNVTAFTYDSHGNKLTRTDADGNITSFQYNSAGQVTQITDALGNKTTFSYDGFGNLISTTDPLGNTTSTVYDNVSRPIATQDAVGRVSRIAYDSLDLVIGQTNPQAQTTNFNYDAVGNLLSLTDANGNKTTFAYDRMNRLLTRTDPLGNSDSRTYDKNGNLVQFVDRRGQKSTFTYDSLNRVAGASYQDGSSVTRTYDANGRLVNATDSTSGSFDFTYDGVGHLLSSANGIGSVQYAYDHAGRMTLRQVVGQSTVQYSYDHASNLSAAAMTQANVNFAYDADNRLTTITRGNSVTSRYAYDASSHLLSITHSGGQNINIPLRYTYDAVGNRTSYSTPVAQPLITPAVSNTFNSDNQIVTNGATSDMYDKNGNLVSARNSSGTTTYAWDTRSRLTSVIQPNGQTTTFTYDVAGNLITQIDSGPLLNLTQKFVLDALTNVAYLSRSNGDNLSVLSGRTIDQHLAVLHSNGQIEYRLADAINSTVQTADQNGKPVSSIDYEPFGQTTTVSTFPFQFTGREPSTGSLYYYRARSYNAIIGRFIQQDPLGFGGLDANLYRYARNNPMRYGDPSGLQVEIFCSVECSVEHFEFPNIAIDLAEETYIKIASKLYPPSQEILEDDKRGQGLADLMLCFQNCVNKHSGGCGGSVSTLTSRLISATLLTSLILVPILAP
jgi:RHS repeat-associated protein